MGYFFLGKDNEDQLCEIVKFMGREDLDLYMEKYKIKIDEKYLKKIPKGAKRQITSFINSENQHLVTAEGLDLL